ncbi:MAG: hypothetical protein ACFBRM_06180 [Pikeienuella sp.]
MAVFRVNVTAEGALLTPRGEPATGALARLLPDLPLGADVCVLIHGFRYTWRQQIAPEACPHARLYATRPVRPSPRRRPCRAAWPAELGFAQAEGRERLAIAFAWEARVGRHGRLGFGVVHQRAERAGAALAGLLTRLAGLRPDLAVDIFAHSLGARVALAAGLVAPQLPFRRLLLLGAAEHVAAADAWLSTVPQAEAIHLLSRANDLYDAAFAIGAPGERGRAPLGRRGLGRRHPRWLDLQIDHPAFRSWTAARDRPLARAPERVSHWHFYADHGAMALYRGWLRDPRAGLVPRLRGDGVPEVLEPRWARLLPRFGRGFSRGTRAILAVDPRQA